MMLPSFQQVVIDRMKVVDYLLNSAHPDNGGKAAFFNGWGFAAADWTRFADAVRSMVASTQVIRVVQSTWGEKYVVDGPLTAPKGTTPVVRTVWIADRSSLAPRLVTAYPKE